MLVEDRHQRIIKLIGSNGSVQVSDLVDEFGVSRMTINRDLDHLAGVGALAKVHGGAIAVQEPGGASSDGCFMCGRDVGGRTAMTLIHESGSRSHACCPHCGLMSLSQHADVSAAVAQDFIGGHTVNVRSATFLFAPAVTVCCSPTVLCFEEADSADRFRRGFGGTPMSWDEAQTEIQGHMKLLTTERGK